MKLFGVNGVDVSVKFIIFRMDGEEYYLSFRDGVRKGVHDISIHHGKGEKELEIISAYPPLKKWLPDVWRIYFPCWLRSHFRKFKQLHNL